MFAAMIFSFGYTTFSEWLNIDICEAWTYRYLMPVNPVIYTGLYPVPLRLLMLIAAYHYPVGWHDR